MKYILHPQPNGKLAITIPCIDIELSLKDIPENTPYKVVDTLNIYDKFFDAYEFDAEKGAVLNIEKAKDIKRDQFRQARKPLLEQLDIAYMRAVETSDSSKKKTIAAKKQQLRNITELDLPDDMGELVACWPAILTS